MTAAPVIFRRAMRISILERVQMVLEPQLEFMQYLLPSVEVEADYVPKQSLSIFCARLSIQQFRKIMSLVLKFKVLLLKLISVLLVSVGQTI